MIDIQRRNASDDVGSRSDVPVEDHLRDLRIKLGESVVQRERVYLDKRYWILLRDIELGRSTNLDTITILNFLKKGVFEKRLVCPISDAVFFELLKQSDPSTRLATAGLIDQLSEGVTLAPQHERIATEVAHWVYSLAGYSVYPLEALVWLRLSYVLGVIHPHIDALSRVDQNNTQKVFVDHMWNIPLIKLIEILKDSSPSSLDHSSIAENLNNGIARHATQIKSFNQVYLDEFYGALSLAAPIACEVIEALAIKQLGPTAIPSPAQREQCTNQIFNLMCASISKPETYLAMRTLHISALCHAAVRWNKGHRLTGNDLYDFQHAAAALAYCNVFLTEGPLHTLLIQNHLHIKDAYDCRIISSLSEAAKWAFLHD